MKITKLGSIEISTDLMLAPMMDVTTPTYVLLCKHYGGVGLYTMPMVFINQIAQAPKTIRPIAEFVEKYRPSGVQICGSGRSPEITLKAVEILNSYNFDFLDINCGCPARRTCSSGGGVSLMRSHRFQDLRNLIHTTIKTSNKPVSVKIRLGWDSTDGLKDIVKLINDEGASFLTIHGRLGNQKYSGKVNLDLMRKIKSWSDIPVVGNGDVIDALSYRLMKKKTNVDAIMIGRGSQGYPSIFSDILDSLNKKDFTQSLTECSHYYGEWRNKVTHINTLDNIQDYIRELLSIIEDLGQYWNNERYKLKELRRNAIWMLKGLNNSRKTKSTIGRSKSLSDLLDYIFNGKLEEDLKNVKK
ncbi:MAG: hypothetical protein GF364_06725 [Candidatus Lokiarchaeota archaeon]|nr:hypothetical protein [Candidatus Lokiarchaeota archaeon]